jgi:hypothetical protein
MPGWASGALARSAPRVSAMYNRLRCGSAPTGQSLRTCVVRPSGKTRWHKYQPNE